MEKNIYSTLLVKKGWLEKKTFPQYEKFQDFWFGYYIKLYVLQKANI